MDINELVQSMNSFHEKPPTNEANTCDLVIRPILLSLGYLPFDIHRESRDEGGNFPDYTLLPADDENRFFVEAKAWNVNLDDKHAKQAISYAHMNGGRWVILTNGRVWRLYDDQIRGIPATKLVAEIELCNPETATIFFDAIRKEAILRGSLDTIVKRLAATSAFKVEKKLNGAESATANESRITMPATLKDSRYFWHICGRLDRHPINGAKWWSFLREKGTITAGFAESPGDEGERILTGYRRGDIVLAYMVKLGAVGWGIIDNPQSYRLLKPGDADDYFGGMHLHRLDICWQACAVNLIDAIRPEEMRNEFSISHPPRTSLPIYASSVCSLIEEMTRRFGVWSFSKN